MSMTREDSCQLFYPEIKLLARLMDFDRYFEYERSDNGNDEDNIDFYTLRNSFNKVSINPTNWNDLKYRIFFMYGGYYGKYLDYFYKELSLEETVKAVLQFTEKLNHPFIDMCLEKLIEKKNISKENAEKIISVCIEGINSIEENDIDSYIDNGIKLFYDVNNDLFIQNEVKNYFVNLSYIKSGLVPITPFNYDYKFSKKDICKNFIEIKKNEFMDVKEDIYIKK